MNSSKTGGIMLGLRLSVIIPTCSREAELKNCLAALACGGRNDAIATTEYIVMDDDSGHGRWSEVLASMRHLDFQCTSGPRRGPAANRNAGASLAKGEWLVFLDDDCVPNRDHLEALARYIHEHPNIRAIEGRTYPDRPQRSLAERGPFNEKGGCFYSCNIALRRDLFDELGGFDEDYEFSLEDLDLYTRLIKKGEPIAFVPEAAVMHPQKEGLGWGFFWSMQRGRRTYLRKHPDQAKSYSCEQMWKIWLHDLWYKLLPDTVRFRGRGLGRRLVYEGLAFCAPLLLKLPDRKTRHL